MAGTALSRLVEPFGRTETYRRLAYLLLAVPLGLAYFVVFTVGLLVAAALSLTFFFFFIGILLVLASRYVAEFERAQARRFLVMDVQAPNDTRTDDDSFWSRLWARLSAGSTWKGIGFFYAKFGLGLGALAFLWTPIALALVFVLAPVLFLAGVDLTLFGVGLESLTATVVAVPVGGLLLLLLVPLAVFTTRLWETPTNLLLDRNRR